MTTPTITATSATKELLLITDSEGISTRIPKVACVFTDTSNGRVSRVSISHYHGEISLLFSSGTEVTTFLSQVDSLY